VVRPEIARRERTNLEVMHRFNPTQQATPLRDQAAYWFSFVLRYIPTPETQVLP
jgi:hypothetical protein